MTVVALLGVKAFWLLLVWLGSAIVASFLSDRKGYGEKPGLVTGITLSFVAIGIWLVWPAKRDSRWKLQGPLGRGDGRTVAQLRADHAGGDGGGASEGGEGTRGDGEGTRGEGTR